MDLLRPETKEWFPVAVLALVELAVLVFLTFHGKSRRRSRLRDANPGPVEVVSRQGSDSVLREIARLCSGEDLDESLIKQMTAEDRALFDVSIIDILNESSREEQLRLRSALVKYGYDEQCARRVLSEHFSEQMRASALLGLLRPQRRDDSIERE